MVSLARFCGGTDPKILKVVDTNPSTSLTGQLTDVTQVDKFELSPEEYAQRRDTVLAFKQRNKVGRFAEKEPSAEPEVAPESVNIPVGSRCEIESLEPGLSKRGTVRFVGATKFSKGVWIGVEYDEPLGKNDGSYVISESTMARQLIRRKQLYRVQGERYFTCASNYGVFVKPEKVRVGDYPVEQLEVEMEEEEM